MIPPKQPRHGNRMLPQPLIAGMIRDGRSPAQIVERCQELGYVSGRGESGWRNMVLERFDGMIGKGLVRRSRIFFLVGPQTRDLVAESTRELGRYWVPGDRTGLLKDLIRQHPDLPAIDLEVCIRYGPVENLFGDLYLALREYELLLFALIRGVLVEVHGPERTGWWREGVPKDVRKELASNREELNLDDDWQAMTLGAMSAIMTSNPSKKHFVAATKVPSEQLLRRNVALVGKVRNVMMHPVRQAPVQESDFVTVSECLEQLRNWVSVAIASGSLAPGAIPGPEILISAPDLGGYDEPAAAGRPPIQPP